MTLIHRLLLFNLKTNAALVRPRLLCTWAYIILRNIVVYLTVLLREVLELLARQKSARFPCGVDDGEERTGILYSSHGFS